jgi:ATP-dependent RNA helicase RhlE
MAISFCDIEERPYLKDIEKLIQQKITVVHEHPFINDTLESVSVEPEREHGHKRNPKPNPKKKSSGKNNYWRKRGAGTRKSS